MCPTLIDIWLSTTTQAYQGSRESTSSSSQDSITVLSSLTWPHSRHLRPHGLLYKPHFLTYLHHSYTILLFYPSWLSNPTSTYTCPSTTTQAYLGACYYIYIIIQSEKYLKLQFSHLTTVYSYCIAASQRLHKLSSGSLLHHP